MFSVIILLAIVGVVLWLVPMDERIRNVIVVLVIVYAIAALFGYAPLPAMPRLRG